MCREFQFLVLILHIKQDFPNDLPDLKKIFGKIRKSDILFIHGEENLN